LEGIEFSGDSQEDWKPGDNKRLHKPGLQCSLFFEESIINLKRRGFIDRMYLIIERFDGRVLAGKVLRSASVRRFLGNYHLIPEREKI
jgi:hypothetical protein